MSRAELIFLGLQDAETILSKIEAHAAVNLVLNPHRACDRVLFRHVRDQEGRDPPSADGGKTWVSAPSSLQAKTTVTGLPVGTSVLFRYRTLTKTGEGDWSQGLALLVK